MVDQNLSSNLIVYINSSYDIPCGVLKGALTTDFEVMWDISIGQGLKSIVYSSSQENVNVNVSDSSGKYSYNPVTSILHVANFWEYENSRSPTQINCTVQRTISGSTERVTRIINVTVSYGKSLLAICMHVLHAVMQA